MGGEGPAAPNTSPAPKSFSRRRWRADAPLSVVRCAAAASPPHRPRGANTVATRPGGGLTAKAAIYDSEAVPDSYEGEEVPTGPDGPSPFIDQDTPLTPAQEAKQAKLEQLGISPDM